MKREHISRHSSRKAFEEDYQMHLDHLQQATHLFILLNISLFFLTQLVIKQGYYYTFYSLFCFGIVQAILLLPLRVLRKLWFYWCLLAIEFIGIYFLVSSLVYWINSNRVIMN